MKREIKFRAWYIDKMYDVENILWFTNPRSTKYGEIMSVTIFDDDEQYKNKKSFTVSLIKQLKKVELMQFTGLRDEDGKEIFEGDIVETAFVTSIIEWNDDICKFQFSNGGDINDGNFYGVSKKVIGNIYENPDLVI